MIDYFSCYCCMLSQKIWWARAKQNRKRFWLYTGRKAQYFIKLGWLWLRLSHASGLGWKHALSECGPDWEKSKWRTEFTGIPLLKTKIYNKKNKIYKKNRFVYKTWIYERKVWTRLKLSNNLVCISYHLKRFISYLLSFSSHSLMSLSTSFSKIITKNIC